MKSGFTLKFVKCCSKYSSCQFQCDKKGLLWQSFCQGSAPTDEVMEAVGMVVVDWKKESDDDVTGPSLSILGEDV